MNEVAKIRTSGSGFTLIIDRAVDKTVLQEMKSYIILLFVAVLVSACSEEAKPQRKASHEVLIELPEALNFPIKDGEQDTFQEQILKIPASEQLILRWKIPKSGNPKIAAIRDSGENFVESIGDGQSSLVIDRNNSHLPETNGFAIIFAEDYNVTKRTKNSVSDEMSTPRLFLNIIVEKGIKLRANE